MAKKFRDWVAQMPEERPARIAAETRRSIDEVPLQELRRALARPDPAAGRRRARRPPDRRLHASDGFGQDARTGPVGPGPVQGADAKRTDADGARQVSDRSLRSVSCGGGNSHALGSRIAGSLGHPPPPCARLETEQRRFEVSLMVALWPQRLLRLPEPESGSRIQPSPCRPRRHQAGGQPANRLSVAARGSPGYWWYRRWLIPFTDRY